MDVQSFVGKINFLRWFILNFAEIIKKIIVMLKNDQEVKWTVEARSSFKNINQAITEYPMLVSADFSK